MKTRLLFVTLAVLAAAEARAAEEHRWMLSAEAGGSRIHSDDRSAAGALRLQRPIGARGLVRAQLGLAVASYGALDAGLELHPWPQERVSPFLGVGGGIMGEDEYEGGFFRGTAGLEARLSPRAVLRLALQAGTHDGQAGPHLATIGIGWRF